MQNKDVILLGNPNTGKTTLFNTLTKSNEHTGNWHGVTVDSKEKKFIYNNQTFNLVDLPGIYSLTPLSYEEEVAVDYLYTHRETLVVNIVDINNIYRNLYLTLELIMLNQPTILVINETTKPQNSLYNIDEKKLQKILGINVLKLNAENVKEINNLKKQIFNFYNNKNSQFLVNKGKIAKIKNNKINELLQQTTNLIKNHYDKNLKFNDEFIAYKCLENDEKIINKLNLSLSQKSTLKILQNEIKLDDLVKEKYEQIDHIFEVANVKKTKKVYGKSIVDKVVLNKYLALPIFLLTMLAIFYLTFFSFGAFLSEQLSNFIQTTVKNGVLSLVKSITNSAIIYDFFATAIIGGLGSVFSFLPQVVILFLCLGILEDSGYLSRVAFSLDDIFSKIGLSGKSVYTLLMGFGCSTTACLTARTMEDKYSQIKTAMLAPYMSCSAKLPIYAVIGSAFFGASNVFVIFAMYMLGVVVALLLSVFYEKTFLKSRAQSFILEFPPYRLTKPKRLLNLAFDNIKMFLVRIGSLLISVNIIVWILANFSFTFAFIKTDGGTSMLETLGKILSPIFIPLGFGSWGATSALLAGLVAKEIIVSSIAMFNGIVAGSDTINSKISQSLRIATNPVCFTPASALSYMVFCLLYSPCLATIAVLRKEVGKKWTFISIIVQFVVAYIMALIVYASTSLILNKGIGVFLIFALVFALCLFAIIMIIKRFKHIKSCKKCASCKSKKTHCKKCSG